MVIVKKGVRILFLENNNQLEKARKEAELESTTFKNQSRWLGIRLIYFIWSLVRSSADWGKKILVH